MIDPSIRPTSLAGKVAVVTGASRGIGLSIARALAARDVRVALLARDAERLDQAAHELGDHTLPLAADISEPQAVHTAFERVQARFGRLDILVNNAGVARPHRVEDASDAELHAQVATNFLGMVYCARAAIPLLRQAGGGDIVNISSDSVKYPFPYLSVYAATKAAVEMFSVALRREVQKDGTRVILLRCGPTWTMFHAAWDPEVAQQAFQTWAAEGYIGRGGCLDPDVVGETVAQAVGYPAQVCPEILEIGPTAHAPVEPVIRQ